MTGEPYDIRTAWSSATTNIPDTATPDEWVEHFNRVFDELAKANAMDDVMSVDGYSQEVANKTPFTKTQVKNLVERRTPDARKQLVADGHLAKEEERIPLDEYVDEHLVKVVAFDVSDSNTSRRYRWEFDGEQSFETNGGEQWDWPLFLEQVYDATGANLDKPRRSDGFEWKQWLRDIANERQERVEILGPRTKAIEQLTREIHSRVAYSDINEVATLGGVWMESEGSTVVGVPGDIVENTAEAHSTTPRGMYAELKAREMLDRNASTHYLENGATMRLWHISTELAEPSDFDPDPDETDTDD